MHGINDLVRFLGGTGDIEDESEIVAADSFSLYQTYFQDRQNVLAHESEKLRAYELLTQRRSVALYETIRRANTFLIAWGTLFLTATLVLSILSAFGLVDWKAAAVTGGLSLAQFVGAFFTQPSSDMQRNLTNLAVFKMVLESHSLKTAVARFHLTTPQALRELHTKLDADAAARQVEALRNELEAIEDVNRADFEALRRLGFSTDVGGRAAGDRPLPSNGAAPASGSRRRGRGGERRRRGARAGRVSALAARHFAGSDRANATPRSTQTASSASSRTDSLSTRIQPGISRPRITTSRADDSSTRRSDSAGSTRSMSPPWPLADTAMLPFTRNARPPNIRCSRTPSSPATSARMRTASSSSYATREACRSRGRPVTSSRRASSLEVMKLDERNAHHVHDSHATDVARGSPRPIPKLRGRQPLPSYDPLAGNPVARAHARRGGASSAAAGSPIGRILLWTVAIPAIVFLVSNPLGWLILFLMCLGVAVPFGGIPAAGRHASRRSGTTRSTFETLVAPACSPRAIHPRSLLRLALRAHRSGPPLQPTSPCCIPSVTHETGAAMTPTHTIIDSPLGELTLVSDDGALTGIYYPGHWYLPDPATFGVRAGSGFEDVEEQLAEYFAGDRTDFDLRTSTAGDAFQERVWELIARIPVRRDDHLWGARTRARRAGDRACRRRRGRPQSALDRRSLPPGRRQGRQAHRLRRRPGAQATASRPRDAHRVPAGSALDSSDRGAADGEQPVSGPPATMPCVTPDRSRLLRRGIRLEWATLTWNVVGIVVLGVPRSARAVWRSRASDSTA